MPISDVFFIRGRGTVVTGRIEAGIVRVGDEVRIGERSLRVDGIEAFRKRLDQAGPGENIGILFGSLKREEVQRGEVITGADDGDAGAAPAPASAGADRFGEVETQRTQFLTMREAGLMTDGQIDQALRGMIFAAAGRQWLLKSDSDRWYSSVDGEEWRHDTPPVVG
jgi:sulfate adenylyltransferase subunit 1 (EFTu-like GTPase family)